MELDEPAQPVLEAGLALTEDEEDQRKIEKMKQSLIERNKNEERIMLENKAKEALPSKHNQKGENYCK